MSGVILGEIGESFPIINGNDFMSTIESIIPEYIKDIVILDQKGMNVDNYPSNNDIQNPETKFYIFNKYENKETILRTIDLIIKKMISSLSFPISINQNNLPDSCKL